MSKEVEFYDSGFGEFEKMMKEYAEKVSEGKALDAIGGRSAGVCKRPLTTSETS